MTKSLYIHIPFCNSICSYCDFSRCIYNTNLVDRYLLQLEKDLKRINTNIETIYIGGGTPTCLNIKQLEQLLSIVSTYTNNCIEYTIEINPENCNLDKIKLLSKYNINRVSIGVQTFNNKLLEYMNRKHNINDIMNLINNLRLYNINNISIDLMYAIKNQTIEDIDNDIEIAKSLNIPHISIYSLTIEENSKWGRNNVESIDIDLESSFYEYIINKLTSSGYNQYEISNFSITNYESKHNYNYWYYEDFYGIGCGASGKEDDYRYDNEFKLDKYLNNVDITNKIYLSREDKMFEHIMMSLRTEKGLDLIKFNSLYDVDFLNIYKDILDINSRYFIISNDCIIVKKEYFPILNDILLNFMN